MTWETCWKIPEIIPVYKIAKFFSTNHLKLSYSIFSKMYLLCMQLQTGLNGASICKCADLNMKYHFYIFTPIKLLSLIGNKSLYCRKTSLVSSCPNCISSCMSLFYHVCMDSFSYEVFPLTSGLWINWLSWTLSLLLNTIPVSVRQVTQTFLD